MTMDRRGFLKLASLFPFAGAAGVAWAAASPARKLFILVELKGGNDGLNMVVPYADPEYARIRPRLAIPRDQVVQLSEQSGLHPSLAPLRAAWDERRLAIVQGVGYPQPNLSHFRSIEIWDTASKSDEYLDAGWLARAFAISPSPDSYAADGVVVGPGAMDRSPARGRARSPSPIPSSSFAMRALRGPKANRATRRWRTSFVSSAT